MHMAQRYGVSYRLYDVHYKEKIDKTRIKTLKELAEQAQELDLGY